ncbi:MAG: hypothetical protein NTX50_03635 [Candidatus Sumerlaeota bacterium]|nr:hypothetical protein [Candidatus Sumerlaeota bacterium]
MNHQTIQKESETPIKVAFSIPALMALDTMDVAERQKAEKIIRALQTSSLTPHMVKKHPMLSKCYFIDVTRDMRLFYEKTSPRTIKVLDLMSHQAIASLSEAKPERQTKQHAARHTSPHSPKSRLIQATSLG